MMFTSSDEYQDFRVAIRNQKKFKYFWIKRRSQIVKASPIGTNHLRMHIALTTADNTDYEHERNNSIKPQPATIDVPHLRE